MAQIIKREIVYSNSNSSETDANDSDQHVSDRRTLRSRYIAVKTLIFGNFVYFFSFCLVWEKMRLKSMKVFFLLFVNIQLCFGKKKKNFIWLFFLFFLLSLYTGKL